MAEEVVERFRPTSGRVVGVLGLLVVAAVVVAAAVEPGAWPGPVVTGALVLGVLLWAAVLRPGLAVTSSDLVMRNMLETVSIPLAAIDEVAVRQVVAVRAGERRYVSPAVGRTWRQALKAGRAVRTDSPTASYADYVEDRIGRAARDAAAGAGVKRFSPEQAALASGVRRQPAWVEIVLLGTSVVAFVVSLVL